MVATSENPLVHYLEKGAVEGRDPSPDFDTAYYLEMSPDVAHKEEMPLYIIWSTASARVDIPIMSMSSGSRKTD